MVQKFNIRCEFSGYGHQKVTVQNYRKKDRTFITTNTQATDDFKDKDNQRVSNRGYKALMGELQAKLRLERSLY